MWQLAAASPMSHSVIRFSGSSDCKQLGKEDAFFLLPVMLFQNSYLVLHAMYFGDTCKINRT